MYLVHIDAQLGHNITEYREFNCPEGASGVRRQVFFFALALGAALRSK